MAVKGVFMSVLCWLSTLIGQSKPKLVSRTRIYFMSRHQFYMCSSSLFDRLRKFEKPTQKLACDKVVNIINIESTVQCVSLWEEKSLLRENHNKSLQKYCCLLTELLLLLLLLLSVSFSARFQTSFPWFKHYTAVVPNYCSTKLQLL